MSAASEAECGVLFINTPTPMKINNNTASGIMNNTVKQKISKMMDMYFYWLQDRVQQGMFRVYWGPGKIT